MRRGYRGWVLGLLAALLAALGLCAAIVAVVDPFFHYRDPDPEAEVWFEERSQTAGLLRSQDYETLLMGTSLAANYRPDPFFHYRDPDPEAEVWFEERSQTAGLLRSQDYETLLMGTSLAANYRPLWFDAYFDTKTVKATLPNGGFHEFTQVLDYACETHEVKRVIFGLDPNILVRPTEEAPDQLPSYLYDSNPWNDGAYLLNKSVLVRALYTAKERAAGNTQSIQDAFVWDGSVFFSKELALAGYQRPEREETVLPADAFLEDCEENLEVVKSWLERYPDTEFLFYYSPYSILFWDKMERQGRTDAMFAALEYATRELLAYDNVTIQWEFLFYYSPYSILFWDKMERQGRTDAMFAALEYATRELLAYDNVTIQCFLTDLDTITDLENYADHIHVAGRVTWRMSKAMAGTEHQLTVENYREKLDALRTYVVNYDYESIWADPAARETE